MNLTHFSLFTGIGGIDLAAEWAGFKTVGQVEINDYATKVLEKHWPSVPRWRDIKDVTIRSIREKGIEHITVLSGGFPCQPVSCAGKQRGKKDDRWLWPEMLRIVHELRPTWIIGENVAGLVGMAQFNNTPPVDDQGDPIGSIGDIYTHTGSGYLEEILEEIQQEGYEVRAFLIPALAVGAWHQRERVFIIAHSGHDARSSESKGEQKISKKPSSSSEGWIYTNTNPISNSNSEYRKELLCWDQLSETGKEGASGRDYLAEGRLWDAESRVGRVVDGVSKRVDRLRCLGNAVVPQQIYPFFKAIANIEGI